jgi:hypothetical protein
MVLQSTSDDTRFITQQLADALRVYAETDVLAKAALRRYDAMFSQKPNVNCRCKEHHGKDVSNDNSAS